MPEKLPPIASLLNEPLSPQSNYLSSLSNASTPRSQHSTPRTQHSFPEAQSLAPAPLSHRPTYSPAPHSEYPKPSRDPRLVYGNGESSYGGSSSRPPSYGGGGGYDSRSQPQDYMGQLLGRPQGYPSPPGISPSYPLSMDHGVYDGDGKQKRRRGNLPKPVTDILRNWFQEHVAHPYPTEEEKQSLMLATGLSLSQISNWFINARRRSLPQITKQAQTEADLRDSGMHLNH